MKNYTEALQYLVTPIMQWDIELSSDILQPISLEEWPLLQKLLKFDWPDHSNYYSWIENSIKWKNQDPDLALQIYCPQGRYQDDTTFVGISSGAGRMLSRRPESITSLYNKFDMAEG